jgi:ubiquinone/menaquinone biosynthesis C-methylase UbiE
MKLKSHWDQIYASKAPSAVGWYQSHLKTSLELIRSTGVTAHSKILDIGGGASTLVDDLLDAGFEDITILDISMVALRHAMQRLGERASQVRWMEGDITCISLPALHYDLWHDRAVFHFLTDPEKRQAYMAAMEHAVKPGGSVIVATFAPSGPPRCSGLEVVRYSPDSLQGEFGKRFTLTRRIEEAHVTPWRARQDFMYCLFRKGDPSRDVQPGT